MQTKIIGVPYKNLKNRVPSKEIKNWGTIQKKSSNQK
jgi:hypothetical protein